MEVEIKTNSVQLKLELELGLSLTIREIVCYDYRLQIYFNGSLYSDLN